MTSPITFVIDGKTVTAQAGETILDVATRNGISIPTLCFNKKISHTTSCFVCVVKDTKRGVFVPACAQQPMQGMNVESSTDEVRNLRQGALNLLLSEHSGDCEAPCTVSCPAHAQVEEYVRAGRQGDFLKSLEIIKLRIPLPMSIGRVCPRFCEKDCRRNLDGLPVAINEFKRLAADLHYEEYMEPCEPLGERKVAVVGGGPAGLAVAYYLRRIGIGSHIFEAMPEIGGMLRYGIPEYRLPKAILNKELAHFEKMGGIEISTGVRLGKDISLAQLESDFDAVAVTIGCWRSTGLRCAGEKLARFGIDWLQEVALAGWDGENPGTTIVVGGGNTAMDCVRTAVRLGSNDVCCFYRRTEKEMPAEQLEIDEAKEEGVKFEFLVAPVKMEKAGNRVSLTCIRMQLGEPDASGRRRPVPIDGSEFAVMADTVIAAVGQRTSAPAELVTNKWGDVAVDEANLCMKNKVFAAGDCVTGAATVVEAVAGGRKAAVAISDFLACRPHTEPYVINVSRGHWRSMAKDDVVLLKEVSNRSRLKLDHISVEERRTSFKEVNSTATVEAVSAEGTRCYECSCTAKGDCLLKIHSETYGAAPDAIKGEKVVSVPDIRHSVIIFDRNKCIKCGTCIKVCNEVVGKTLLGYKERGFASAVGPAFGQPLPDSCGECMACVEECPTGALDRRHKA